MKYTHKCKRCNKKFISLVEKPKQCALCHNINWNQDFQKCICLKCNYEWDSRIKPKKCASCDSPNWNVRSNKELINKITDGENKKCRKKSI